MKEKSRLTISFEILKNPHIELHDKIVYSVIATLMVDDLLEITFDELALKCGFKRRQIIKSVKSLIALKLLDAIRLACDRLHARRPNASWTLTAIVEEVLAVVREKETEHPGRKTRVD